MKQNPPAFILIVSFLFILILVGAFYYWIRVNKITWKYRREWRDTMNVLSDDEKMMVKKYLRDGLVYFIAGSLLIILLFFLQGTGNLF